jgi:menaquinone-dependent protoporphyrinogen oxidase
MGGKILVAYVTRYGSTGEVAEAVAATLRGHGTEVDVRPAKDVADVGGYRAVVLGTPFYFGSMLKDATGLLERNRAVLETLPVAVFALGPVRAGDDMGDARGQLDQALAKLEWFEPVVTEMFVGKYDPARLRLTDKLITIPPASPFHGMGACDDRDWDAIRAWAAGLAESLA